MLADYLAANKYLKEISDEFEEVGIANTPDPDFSGAQRRTLISGYYHSLDFANADDARKFIAVSTLFVADADRRLGIDHTYGVRKRSTSEPDPNHPMARFLAEMRRSGFEWQGGAFRTASPSARLADTKALAEQLDLAHLGEHVRRIENAIDTDPRQAIGSAKEMVETVAKTILERRGSPPDRNADVLELGKAVFKVLKQVPDDVPDAAKGAATIKRMLSNLASVVHGIAELRGFYGTGHGQEGKAKGLSPRHARLAVGAAAALAWYWLETDREMPL